MSNYEIHIKPQIDYKKYGFIKGRSSKDWAIWGNVKNIYFSEKDYVLHFNMLTLDCISKIIDMAKDDVICYAKKNKSKKHCMILDDEEYKLIIENRKKFKNTEAKATMTDIEEIECSLQTIIDFACAYVYEYDNEFDKREFEEATPLVKQAISELKALKENNNKGYTVDDHWQQAFEYQMEAIRNNPMNNIAKLQLYNQTIKECIDLLSTDGQGTKQKVKEKLEGLLK